MNDLFDRVHEGQQPMKPLYVHGDSTIYHGDCREVISTLEPVDAVVTDPPYGLGFMGKGWDHGVPGVDFWEQILAAMKPGAHLLAFGGTRTHHRLMVAIEDAGFEIRDCLMWVYGTGFPKSLDVGKAIDKAAGAEREVVGPGRWNNVKGSNKLQAGCLIRPGGKHLETAPATDAAKRWDGWGTALKPAWEPIVLARKPLEGTVAANVTKHGTGGLNVDGCRINSGGTHSSARSAGQGAGRKTANADGPAFGHGLGGVVAPPHEAGRWPANLIHDGGEEVTGLFPRDEKKASGQAKISAGGQNRKPSQSLRSGSGMNVEGKVNVGIRDFGDASSAARFFYCAKASKAERGEGNDHPTVKPQALMRYLCRLICPPGGVVLDPFMGSGSTLLAARAEGFRAIGIDIEERSCEIARERLR